MFRMITQGFSRSPKGTDTVADQQAIGCAREYISFSFPDGGSYVCDKEKAIADLILDRNRPIWPAVVIFPSGLRSELLYAQCTFKSDPRHDHSYKEAGGINTFLAKGSVVEFLREYNVASLIVGPRSLADVFYRLNEPRIEESLFVIESDRWDVTQYQLRGQSVKTSGWSPDYQFSLTSTGAPYCNGSLRHPKVTIYGHSTIDTPLSRLIAASGDQFYVRGSRIYEKRPLYPLRAVLKSGGRPKSGPPKLIQNRSGVSRRSKVLMIMAGIGILVWIVWQLVTS